MANNPNAIDNLKPQKAGEPGHNPYGRPKKFVSAVLEELKEAGYKNVTRSQISDIYEVLLALPREELVIMGSSDEYPMIYRIIAKAMLGNKGFEVIEKMLNRSQGMPTQPIGNPDGSKLEFPMVYLPKEEE
jgi:hypothetical protein